MTTSGLHLPNARISPSTLEIVQRGNFHSAKLMAYHTAGEVKTLEAAGVTRFFLRLRDSVWQHADGSKYIASYSDYGAALLDDLMRFYGLGIHDFQCDNEPNIAWHDCPSEYDPWIYRAFMLDVLDWLQPHLPTDVRLFAPPLTFSPQYTPLAWLTVLQDVFEKFEGLTANCYWQSSRTGKDNILAGPMTWGQFGANFGEYHKRWPDKPIILGEYGNSIHEKQLFTAAQVDAFRAEQYPLYLNWLQQFPYVEAAYCWIAPTATHDWSGFELTPAVASAMGWPVRP